MARRSYEEALVEWALGRLGGARPAPAADPGSFGEAPAKGKGATGRGPASARASARGGAAAKGKAKAAGSAKSAPPSADAAAPSAPPEADAALLQLRSVFGLQPGEERALQLALAVERSPALAQALAARSGGRGLLAWMVEEIAGPGLLAPAGRLRAHGLLVVDGIPGGTPAAFDVVRLAPGMRERLDGAAPSPASMGMGIDAISAADRGALPEPLMTLMKDDVLGSTARWVSVGGIAPADAEKLAAVVARRLGRDSLRVDGRVVARLAPGDAAALLAAARREVDLVGSALLVDSAAWLGGGLLKAIGAPAVAVSRVLLCDERKVPELAVPAGFTSRSLVLDGAPPADGAARPDVPGGLAAPPPVPPSIEAARRQAALDAARAMGRALDLPPLPPPPPAAPDAPRPPPAASASASAPASAPSTPVAAAEPPRAEPPRAPATPEPELSLEELGRRAAMYVGSSVPARKRSPAERAAAARPATPEPAAPPPDPPPSPGPAMAAPPDPGTPAASSDTTPGSASMATGDPSESLPYVPVPEGATIADLIRLVREAANPFQKAALLRQLGDAGVKDVSVVSLMRAYTTSAHPAVRAAAEYGMLRLFGPTWNRSRPIPKPVQPPRSDDDKGS